MTERTPVLATRGISKWFGPVKALTNIDFEVYPGEVVALIGDNGAGKSTLINVITGVLPHEEGEIIFEGKSVNLTPQEARRLGIETVYQDLAIAPHLDSVANIFLGREYRQPGILGKMGFLDSKRMRSDTLQQLSRLRVRIKNIDRRMYDAVRWSATGRGGRPLRALGQQSRDHGRADGGARRRAIRHGARPDQGSPQLGHPDHLHQPQHAARLRGR